MDYGHQKLIGLQYVVREKEKMQDPLLSTTITA
jgi:hypothetical protein